MKRSIPVTIGGHRFQLKSDKDDRAVKQLARFVDEKIREVQKATRSVDTQSAAVLAALQIAEELFEARKAHDETRHRVRTAGERLVGLIDKHARV